MTDAATKPGVDRERVEAVYVKVADVNGRIDAAKTSLSELLDERDDLLRELRELGEPRKVLAARSGLSEQGALKAIRTPRRLP